MDVFSQLTKAQLAFAQHIQHLIHITHHAPQLVVKWGVNAHGVIARFNLIGNVNELGKTRRQSLGESGSDNSDNGG